MIYFIGVILVVGVLLIVHMWVEAHRITVEKKEIHLEHYPESFNGLKVFFISDIHTRSIDERLLDQINEQIDIVIIGGDLMEKGVPFDRASRNIEELSEIAPIYFVWGNNDYEVDYHKLDVLLREKGVKILDNTCARFESGGDSLFLVGVDDPSLMRDDLPLALNDSGEDGYRIMVSHNPKITEKIKKEHRIGIVLSGHTHGGQIRFFKWGIAERGGLKQQGDIKVFISNGFGFTQLPFRLCAPAQTHILTFYAVSDSTPDYNS
jgi:predicted MPP superfamily phosphohydrolase